MLIALAEELRCGRAALRAGGALLRSVRCGSRRRDLCVKFPLQAEGLDAAKLRTAADEVRGGRKISSKDPEASYEAAREG